jgi:hypothetical protein
MRKMEDWHPTVGQKVELSKMYGFFSSKHLELSSIVHPREEGAAWELGDRKAERMRKLLRG